MMMRVSCYLNMEGTTLLLALVSLLIVHINRTTGVVHQEDGEDVQPVHTFQALDCRSPAKVRTGLWDDLCNISNQTIAGTVEKVTISILQYSEGRTAKAVRCTKLQTKALLFCGAYSHMKLMEPLTVMSPVTLE